MRGAVTPTESRELENATLDQLTPQRIDRLLKCSTSRANYLQEFSEVKVSIEALKDSIQNPLRLDSSRITGDNNLRGLFLGAVSRGAEQDAVSIINRAVKYYELQLDFLQQAFIEGFSRRDRNTEKTRSKVGILVGKIFGRKSDVAGERVEAAFSISALKPGDTFVGKVQTSKPTHFNGDLMEPVDFSKFPRIEFHHLHPGQVITVNRVVPERDSIIFEYADPGYSGTRQRECAFTTQEFLHFIGASEA